MPVLTLVLGLLAAQVYSLDNGVAITPPMGWNQWNSYASDINEDLVLDTAKVIQAKFAKSGYNYVNLDCGWSTQHRDDKGNIIVNATRFPHGMKWLGDQIHAMGLKFGTYGATGYHMCCSNTADKTANDGSGPGCDANGVCRTKTFFEQDAQMWASWGVDYLKFDACGGPFSSVAPMRDALNATGRHMVYSVHDGKDELANGTFTPDLANAWRTGDDIGKEFGSMLDRALGANSESIDHPNTTVGGPSAWNNPDMLQVGNFEDSMGDAESRTQMALWCLLKSPLLIGTPVIDMSDAVFDILTDSTAISVNQDSLGKQGVLRAAGSWKPTSVGKKTQNDAYGFQIWSGELSNSGVTAVLNNLNSTAQTLTLTQDLMPPSSTAASWDVTEAFTGKTMTGVTLPQTVTVGPRDTVMWVMTPKANH